MFKNLRSKNFIFFLFALLAIHFTFEFQLNAADLNAPLKKTTQPSATKKLSLKEALQIAVDQNLDLQSLSMRLNQAYAREDIAKAAAYPKLSSTAILSPIYEAKGNALSSTTDLNTWGVWLQSNITALIPLYTWGKISSYKEAARKGVRYTQAEIEQARHLLRYEVKELFYSTIFVAQLHDFLSEGQQEIQETLEKAEKDLKSKKSKIQRRDYYRLKVFSAEADYRLKETLKLKELAHQALALKLGLDEEQDFHIEEPLEPIEDPLPAETELFGQLQVYRPELDQLKYGIAAKKALYDAEKSNQYPSLFLGGLFTFSFSDVRSGQASAYAFDPYNRNSGGAGIGVQWNFDLAATLANASLIAAEISELEKKQSYAEHGLKLELKKALAEMHEAREKLEISKEAFQVGKKWLFSESAGYSLGLTEVKDLVDAYLARAKTTQDYWNAIYKVNMSWAALSKVIGKEITPGLL